MGKLFSLNLQLKISKVLISHTKSLSDEGHVNYHGAAGYSDLEDFFATILIAGSQL
jgi:hypothetical protein